MGGYHEFLGAQAIRRQRTSQNRPPAIMKNPYRLPLLLSALCAFVIGLVCFATPAHAQAAADAATAIAPAADDSTSATTIISVIVAAVSGLIAIWQNKSASTAKKITQSVILGVEQATKLPEVAHLEKRVKETIRQKASDLGVQPLLNRAVRDLTD